MNRSFKYLTLLVMLLMMLPSSLLGAFAQESTPDTSAEQEISLGVFPVGGMDGDRFEFELEPGETAVVGVFLINGGENPLRLNAFASHLIPVVGGGLQIPPSDTPAEGTVSWLNFPSEEMTLGPGESVERVLTVTVPEDAQPGQYVNALALETLDPITEPGSPFEQFYRKVVSVYVTVPGEVVSSFTVSDPTVEVVGMDTVITLPIENTGNIRVDLTGNISLTGPDGNTLFSGSILMGPLYMGQATTVQVFLPGVIDPGDGYQVAYELVDGTSAVSASSEGVAVTVAENASTAADKPYAFDNVSIQPNADPIVFAEVSVDVVNTGVAHSSTRLTMSVLHNGELVEDFVLADNLSLPLGTTTVTQRYLPATEWESGTYTFSLKLESVGSDQPSLLFEQPEIAILEVP